MTRYDTSAMIRRSAGSHHITCSPQRCRHRTLINWQCWWGSATFDVLSMLPNIFASHLPIAADIWSGDPHIHLRKYSQGCTCFLRGFSDLFRLLMACV